MTGNFYRLNNGVLEIAKEGLATPTGNYLVNNHTSYTYPIDGEWRYFLNEKEALLYYQPEAITSLTLSAVQIRVGLINAGITLDKVESAIAAIKDPIEQEIAKTYWEYSTSYNRNHPLVISIGLMLGLTNNQIDVMWNSALDIK